MDLFFAIVMILCVGFLASLLTGYMDTIVIQPKPKSNEENKTND